MEMQRTPSKCLNTRSGTGIAVGRTYWLGFHRGLGNENRTWSHWEECTEPSNDGETASGGPPKTEERKAQCAWGTASGAGSRLWAGDARQVGGPRRERRLDLGLLAFAELLEGAACRMT